MSNDYEDQNDELSEAKADLSAENNAKQLNARMLIGRKSEIARSKSLAEEGGEEMSGVDDGIPDDDPSGGMTDAYPYQVTDETIKSALAGLPKAQELAGDKIRLKVAGEEKDFTLDELKAVASKNLAADKYLAEAAEAKRQAEALLQSTKAPTSTTETAQNSDTPTDEDLEIARALQVGSEEDAARVVARIRKGLIQAPSVDLDAVAKKTEENIEFKQNVSWFREQYPEIFADPDYMLLAVKRDDEIRREELAQGKVSSYRDRYARIGDDLRKKFGIDPKYSEKARKKQETLTNIPQASVKSQRPVEEDEEESTPNVIAQMAKARGQLRI